MKIQLLDQNTINQIAAGEVVERPSSVVKELVENAIDAKATAITVEIKEGGLSLIRVTDNGSGIEVEDIRTAFLRHSTSKIKEVEDLLTIASLGFRGEALASIASVSQSELITKTNQQLTGIRYKIEGGNELAFDEIGCPEGTTLVINNLFFNTPARRKFLKSPITEGAYVAELMNKLALGNPQISFKFVNNGQVKLFTAGNSRLLDCVFTIFGKDIAKNLLEVFNEEDGYRLEGYIGKPSISRANRTYENYYINGRYVKSKVIQKAIEDAYKTKLTLHQYPFVVLHMQMDPDIIDVNVHPTKMEVRFHDEKKVYDLVYETIYSTLNRSELIPEVTFDRQKEERKVIYQPAPEPFEAKRREQFQGNVTNRNIGHESPFPYPVRDTKPVERIVFQPQGINRGGIADIEKVIPSGIVEPKIEKDLPIPQREPSLQTEQPSLTPKEGGIPDSTMVKTFQEATAETTMTPVMAPLVGSQMDYKDTLFISKEGYKEHKIIGQLFQTYWIVEFRDRYYIIDQHAAHERVLYDDILQGLKEKKAAFSQGLLVPQVVQLSMQEKLRLEAHQELFKSLGFDVEDFGNDAVAIRSVPFIFQRPIQAEDFLQILDLLDDEYREERYELLLDEIASMACKAAVKAHDALSTTEYEHLMDRLLALENPFNCPHGRPTMIAMTRYELEKKFKRIQ